MKHPEEAVSIHREMLSVHWQAHTKQATLKFAADLNRDLKVSDNPGFYDERIALWQVVRDLLVKETRTAAEDSAIDLGLFNLVNDLVVRTDYDSIKFAKNFQVDILEGIGADDPDFCARYSKLDITYPDATRWKEIITTMNRARSNYASEKERQEQRIANLVWANSPEGLAAIDVRRRLDDADHARWNREHLEREWEAELGKFPECRID